MRLMIPVFVSSMLSIGFAQAQVDWDAVEVRARPVRGAVHVIFGRGGNIGLCVGAAWSVPAIHREMSPIMRCHRVSRSCMTLSMACPMCRAPVTLGRGIMMT